MPTKERSHKRVKGDLTLPLNHAAPLKRRGSPARKSELLWERASSLGCGSRQGVDDVVDHLRDEVPLVAPAHDANHRLGAGGANHETSLSAETLTRRCDGRHDGILLQRLAGEVAHVLEDLRQRLEAVADLADRLLEPLDHGQQLKRGEEAVAG